MMSVITIGIDPGLTGAVAILENGKFRALFDMPTSIKGGTGKVKYEVLPSALKRRILENVPADSARKAIIERVNSRPGQGAATTFSLGDSFGAARTVLACCNIPYVEVTPASWKKNYNLSSDKEQSRALASKLFPEAELHLKKHHDRAEAILMAKFLYDRDFK